MLLLGPQPTLGVRICILTRSLEKHLITKVGGTQRSRTPSADTQVQHPRWLCVCQRGLVLKPGEGSGGRNGRCPWGPQATGHPLRFPQCRCWAGVLAEAGSCPQLAHGGDKVALVAFSFPLPFTHVRYCAFFMDEGTVALRG